MDPQHRYSACQYRRSRAIAESINTNDIVAEGLTDPSAWVRCVSISHPQATIEDLFVALTDPDVRVMQAGLNNCMEIINRTAVANFTTGFLEQLESALKTAVSTYKSQLTSYPPYEIPHISVVLTQLANIINARWAQSDVSSRKGP